MFATEKANFENMRCWYNNILLIVKNEIFPSHFLFLLLPSHVIPSPLLFDSAFSTILAGKASKVKKYSFRDINYTQTEKNDNNRKTDMILYAYMLLCDNCTYRGGKFTCISWIAAIAIFCFYRVTHVVLAPYCDRKSSVRLSVSPWRGCTVGFCVGLVRK